MSTTFFHNNVNSTPTAPQLTNYLDALRAFWLSIAGSLANNAVVHFPSTQECIDIDTGVLNSVATTPTPPADVIGLGSGGYVAGTGAKVWLNTTNIRNHRFVRGWMFLTPLVGSAMDASGGLATSLVTSIDSAAATFLAALSGASIVPCVYHSPHPIGSSGGMTADVDTMTTRRMACSIRSRRM